MRWVILAIVLSGCASTDKHMLSYVPTDAPMWNLNPGLWAASSNDITAAPTLPINVGPQAH